MEGEIKAVRRQITDCEVPKLRTGQAIYFFSLFFSKTVISVVAVCFLRRQYRERLRASFNDPIPPRKMLPEPQRNKDAPTVEKKVTHVNCVDSDQPVSMQRCRNLKSSCQRRPPMWKPWPWRSENLRLR